MLLVPVVFPYETFPTKTIAIWNVLTETTFTFKREPMGDPPPSMGHVGRARACTRCKGVGCPGTSKCHGPSRHCQPGWHEGNVRHGVRKSQHYCAFRELERRQPGFFRGLGGAVHRQACWDGLQVASTEAERSILRGLLTGSTWTRGEPCGTPCCGRTGVPFAAERRRRSRTYRGTARAGNRPAGHGCRRCRKRRGRCRRRRYWWPSRCALGP